MTTDRSDASTYRSERAAERRQVTVLFYDLVGSTRLAEAHDPEDVRVLQHAFHQACTGVINRYRGSVERFMGDGAVAYFGYPVAHEDDPERAVSAGLDIVEACAGIAHPSLPGARLSVRIGIATGMVVVGEHPVAVSSREPDVVGVTPNLAARLQAAAPPDAVLISQATHDLVQGVFLCEATTPLDLKGFAERQQAWHVLARRSGVDRFAAKRRSDQPPLLARDEELEALERRWAAAGGGRGQVVLVCGEPGIGKSRLVDALRARLAGRELTRITCQCSPYHREVPLYPVVSHIRWAISGNGAPATAAGAAPRLRALLGQSASDVEEAVRLVGALLWPSAAGGEAAGHVNAEALRRRQLACLADQIDGLARRRPVLLVVEDAHWIDPSSEELLDLLVERAQRLRALIIVTYRPDYLPRWTGQPHVSLMALSRLDDRQSAELVRAVAQRALPPRVVARIVARGDGVPLYVEELTRAVALDRTGQPPAEVEIPASLSDFLTSRLDQLGGGKEIAQVASAFGRSFALDLLAPACDRPDGEVAAALGRMVELGLAVVRGGSGGREYVFRHALIQEAAYRSMLRGRRRAVHRRIAEVLSDHPETGGEAGPEALARHFEAAGMAAEAIPLLNAAARAAASRSANLEAARLLDRALRLVPAVEEGPARAAQELALLVSLGPVLITTSGAGSADVQALYKRAIRLCEQLPAGPAHFTAHWGWWLTAPDFAEMRRRADALSELAARLDDPEFRLQAHHCQWGTLFNLGRHAACLEHIERGLAIYEGGEFRGHGVLYGGHDPKVCALGQRSLALWLTGAVEASAAACDAALAHAEGLHHAGSLGHALDFELMLCRYRGEAGRVLDKAEALARFADAQSFRDLAARARIFRGWARAMLGRADGIAQIEQGLAAQRRIGTEEDFPVYYEMLADSLAAAGRSDEALVWVEEAVALAEKSGLQFWLAELHRRAGELRLGRGERAAALAAFRRAAAIAEAQGARSLLMRARDSLGRAAGPGPPAASAPGAA